MNFMATLAFRTSWLTGKRDTRARAKREAKRKLPVVTPLFMPYRTLEMIDMKRLRRTNLKTITFIGAKQRLK